MTLLEDIRSLNKTTVLTISLVFIGLIAPGLLTLYLFKPVLFATLDSLKLLLFSLALSAPGLFVPYVVSTIAAKVLDVLKPGAAARLGGPIDWFASHTATNGFNFYLSLLLAYLLKWRFITFLVLMIALLALATGAEMWRVVLVARGRTQPSSLL